MTSYPTVSQSQSGGYYMDNLVSIGQFLISNGYSAAAAAGIAGTIAGESTGNPESAGSGGDGLIGWTPPGSAQPSGSDIPTGNWQKDFDSQLTALINYANSNSQEAVSRGGVDLSTLKAATDPVQAASWWSAFEGPLVPGSDIRTGVVQQIAQNLQGYKPNSGYVLPAGLDAQPGGSPGGGSPTQCLGVKLPGWLGGACLGATVPSLSSLEGILFDWLERFGLFILGGALVLMGLYVLVRDSSGGKLAVKTGKGAAKDAAIGAIAA